ncbi:ATP-binding cassette domain-containing protein [Enteractinococcus fodinae]|uniref:ABC-2 type transport system ATP-binding protein n=1 Tax=Enteractinococcus fodinae TaxID=684663 RepID=A0ABU2AY92_9MICC|nr:ATP-binding cassette domain-containing protein [Enteractinococcus fodinae]MDR7346121.1 ABC-2 type transport system ATP-binding protein [Enteractinococcus fodinae]
MLGLELHDIGRSFGDRQVLHSVDLAVAPGEIVGIIGGNGAGKTTTMRLILGLIEASEGTITWDGEPITARDRRAIGYMPDERGLYPQMSVVEQLVHFALLEGETITQARRTVSELIDTLGLTSRERSRVQDLSLGDQQRVQLAVALVGHPSLLVLDEPFAGLDPLAVETLAALIRQQAESDVGVLFSSQQLEFVERLCDRVCVLDKGRIAASGRVTELQADSYSRWALSFSEDLPDLLIAELSIIPGLIPTAVEDDPKSVMITLSGRNREIPEEVLHVALRHGGLRSIRCIQRSLAEILADRLKTGPVRKASTVIDTGLKVSGAIS